MKWISPEECKSLLAAHSTELIDVREVWEYEICRIGAINIPMHTIGTEAAALDSGKSCVIVCKTGRRAEAVANLLEKEHGFTNVAVLQGGIAAWYALTDPTYELY